MILSVLVPQMGSWSFCTQGLNRSRSIPLGEHGLQRNIAPVTFCDECDKCFHLTDPFSDGVCGAHGRLPCHGPNLYLRRWMQVAHQVSKGSPATHTIECIASPCPHHFLSACSEMLPRRLETKAVQADENQRVFLWNWFHRWPCPQPYARALDPRSCHG